MAARAFALSNSATVGNLPLQFKLLGRGRRRTASEAEQ
jgi:hypothetical protein